MCSAIVSSSILWKSRGTRDFIVSVSVAFGFIITFVVYIRIYLTIRRHKNQIYSLQVQEVAQSNDMKKFAVLVKSTLGMFYAYLVFLICYLPFFICTAFVGIYGSSILLKKSFLFYLTPMLLNPKLTPMLLNPKFIFEPCNLLLEDEKHSTCYHGDAAEHFSEKKSATLLNSHSIYKRRPR